MKMNALAMIVGDETDWAAAIGGGIQWSRLEILTLLKILIKLRPVSFPSFFLSLLFVLFFSFLERPDPLQVFHSIPLIHTKLSSNPHHKRKKMKTQKVHQFLLSLFN